MFKFPWPGPARECRPRINLETGLSSTSLDYDSDTGPARAGRAGPGWDRSDSGWYFNRDTGYVVKWFVVAAATVPCSTVPLMTCTQ